MYKQRQPLEYKERNGTWVFNLPKSYKGIHTHAGVQIIIDSGTPTGEIGNFYQPNDKNGLENSFITIRGYDDMTGWISSVKYPLPELLEALTKLLPSESVEEKTTVATINDLVK